MYFSQYQNIIFHKSIKISWEAWKFSLTNVSTVHLWTFSELITLNIFVYKFLICQLGHRRLSTLSHKTYWIYVCNMWYFQHDFTMNICLQCGWFPTPSGLCWDVIVWRFIAPHTAHPPVNGRGKEFTGQIRDMCWPFPHLWAWHCAQLCGWLWATGGHAQC